MRPTDEQIARLRELDQAATSVPWEIDGHSHMEDGCRCLSCGAAPTVFETSNGLFCDDIPQRDADTTRCTSFGYTIADAELIVAARNTLPALLDAVVAERDRADKAEARIAAVLMEHDHPAHCALVRTRRLGCNCWRAAFEGGVSGE